MKNINIETIAIGALLTPKRGKALDPVIVGMVSRPDRKACVRDAALVLADPRWKANRSVDTQAKNGAKWQSIRELRKDYKLAGIVGKDGELEDDE